MAHQQLTPEESRYFGKYIGSDGKIYRSMNIPRSGKNIIVTTWEDNGKQTQKTLKWNGHGFSY